MPTPKSVPLTARLGPVEKAILTIALAVITSGVIAGVSILWNANVTIGILREKAAALERRVDRLESRLFQNGP